YSTAERVPTGDLCYRLSAPAVPGSPGSLDCGSGSPAWTTSHGGAVYQTPPLYVVRAFARSVGRRVEKSARQDGRTGRVVPGRCDAARCSLFVCGTYAVRAAKVRDSAGCLLPWLPARWPRETARATGSCVRLRAVSAPETVYAKTSSGWVGYQVV